MKKRAILMTIAALLTFGVVAGSSGHFFDSLSVVKAENTERLIVDGSQLTSTATDKVTEKTYGGLKFVFSSGAKYQSSTGDNKFADKAILIGKSGAYIYNKDPFPGDIVSFKIYANKGASTKVTVGVKFSSTPISSYSESSDNTFTGLLSELDHVYDCSSKIVSSTKYFWYQVTNANNSQVEFEIIYKKNTSSTAKSITYVLGDSGENNKDNPTSFEPGTGVSELFPATRNGFKFLGWKINGEGEYITSIPSTATEDITLVAIWGEIDISNISSLSVVNQIYKISGEVTFISSTSNAIIQDTTGAILIYDYSAITTNKLFAVGNTVTLKGTYAIYNGYGELKEVTSVVVEDEYDTTVDTAPLTNISDVNSNNQFKRVSLSKVLLDSPTKINGTSFTLTTSTNTENGNLLVKGSYVNIEGYVNYINSTAQLGVISVTSVKQYTITYNTNGGSSVTSQSVLEGAKFTRPNNPTKETDINYSYTFGGWYTDNGTWQDEFDFDVVPTADVTVYAKWNQTESKGEDLFEPNYTLASLKFSYEKTQVIGDEANVKTSYKGDTINMAENENSASLLNLDPDLFTVIGNKGECTFNVGLNSAGDCRIYYNADGSNTLSIECDGIITSISLTFTGDSYKNAYVEVDGEIITPDNGVYTINASSFVIGNANTSSNQVRIKEISINYKAVNYSYSVNKDANEKDMMGIRFCGVIPAALKQKLDNSGSTVTYGVAYKKSGSETYTYKELDGAYVANAQDAEAATESLSEAVENEYFFQYALTITGIPSTHYETVIEAAAFVCIDGEYTYMNIKSYSVKSLATEYVNKYSEDPAVKEHLGVLKYLAGIAA